MAPYEVVVAWPQFLYLHIKKLTCDARGYQRPSIHLAKQACNFNMDWDETVSNLCLCIFDS